MIAFGTCIGSEEKHQRFAAPSIARFGEVDSLVAESRDNTSIFSAYNEMLDHFSAVQGLEGLVLLHEDVEILDASFCEKVRRVVAAPGLAVAGVVGARGVTSLSWWEGQGRGRCAETRGVVDFGGGEHDVEAVDGLMMILSPWAVRNLRFDEARYSGFHAYDVDFCFSALQAGKRVVVTDLDVFHHTKGGYGDVAAFSRADTALRAKWEAPGRLRRERVGALS